MSDRAREVLAEAVREHLGFHDMPDDENGCCADHILEMADAAIAVMEEGDRR